MNWLDIREKKSLLVLRTLYGSLSLVATTMLGQDLTELAENLLFGIVAGLSPTAGKSASLPRKIFFGFYHLSLGHL